MLTTLNKIILTQYRNYLAATYEFVEPVTCITGANGSGKTNLLDAIYYLCYTKSYFTSFHQHTVMNGADGFRVEGFFEHGAKKEQITCVWKQGVKEISRDKVAYDKPTDHIGRYAAVMIAPDDLELINAGSEPRRKWLDGILCQTDKNYFEQLTTYMRILQQRNAWLKQQAFKPSNDFITLEYFDSLLVSCGNYIHQQRRSFIHAFLPALQELYNKLSGHKETVNILYHTELDTNSFESMLKAGLEHDLRMQRTLKGIHKDDLIFSLNNSPVKVYGSQGQKKSFLFALKLAQYQYLSGMQGKKPLLLLDDVFEKLDQTRMEALLSIIANPGFGQVVLTDTHPERVRKAFGDSTEPGFIYLSPGPH